MKLYQVNYFVFLGLGVISAILPKLFFETDSVGIDEYGKHSFRKPHFISLLAFFGSAIMTVPYIIKKLKFGDSDPSYYTNGSFLKLLGKIAIVAIFEIFSTLFMNVGLLDLPISSWQVLRGSMPIFSSVLSTLFLKETLEPYQWMGISMNFLSIVVICFYLFYSRPNHTLYESGLSIILTLLSQFFQAIQYLLEMLFFSESHYSSEMVIGVEGSVSSIFEILIFFPIVHNTKSIEGNGIHEDALDSFLMIKNSSLLFYLSIAYPIVVFLYVFMGTSVVSLTKAVSRTALSSLRTVMIIIVQIVFYYGGNNRIGVEFNVLSLFELIGLIILIFGIMIYEGLFKLPFFSYPQDSQSDSFEGLIDNTAPLVLQNNISIY